MTIINVLFDSFGFMVYLEVLSSYTWIQSRVSHCESRCPHSQPPGRNHPSTKQSRQFHLNKQRRVSYKQSCCPHSSLQEETIPHLKKEEWVTGSLAVNTPILQEESVLQLNKVECVTMSVAVYLHSQSPGRISFSTKQRRVSHWKSCCPVESVNMSLAVHTPSLQKEYIHQLKKSR